MLESAVKEAFGFADNIEIKKLSTGLINHTYKAISYSGHEHLLQQINTAVFPNPLLLQQNYQQIQAHLNNRNSYKLPKIVPTRTGQLIFEYEGTVWRCFQFIPNTYSPLTSSNANEAWLVANCFGKFSAELSGLPPKKIGVVLPGFHDLHLRYRQFELALKSASEVRTKQAQKLIEIAIKNKSLVDLYDKISKQSNKFPLHILHHDCKIANILFKEGTHEIYSPIDIDTTQPGLFFSDLGDMIRSMTPNISENDIQLQEMELRKDFYQAVRDGYLHAMKDHLTNEELTYIDYSGRIIVYMQALRFLADYLNNDIYYQTSYPEQNKDRAENQLQLLALLDDYIHSLSKTKIYQLN